ncbi:hypothetical protein HRQ91_11220 [Treponema parvum]|uniref:Uncharacterized protein n=1 Tax=Treponema parvum TaxID=138851 RepID=A0A975IGB6_9SPIR|nr:hypothetical protein [Treponema parvum]QTQ14984.1 hypothetical protein HRQ91_11220 [Treponema parvum]
MKSYDKYSSIVYKQFCLARHEHSAKSALTNFTTAGFTSIAKGTKTATQVALAATSSTITTVGNKAIDNYTLGGSFDKSSFMISLGSIQTWGGVASSALTTGINLKTAEKLKRLGEKGAAISKFYGGAINLGTSFAGKGAEFGTYAIDALANGKGLYSAYDNMGGISMNVASLGAMMDFAGTMMSRNNKSGQSAMSVLAEAFSGQGIYEINIGTNGITGKFGNGGIDVGGNVYDLAKRMSDKSNLAKYASSNGQAKGEAAYYAYVYGDWTQENTAARIANGKDTLIFDNTNDFIARTERDAKGGRTITMKNSGDKYVNAIQLGHESYRNGTIGTTAEQNAETIAAVIGHTEMAVRMEDYQSYKAQGLLGSEVEAYRRGDMTSLFMNAMANYDSSGDYWKFKLDGTIEDDGKDYFSREIIKENGEFGSEKIEGSDFTGSRVAALIKAIGFENAEKMLGKDWNNSDLYSTAVLKEIGLTDDQITKVQHSGKFNISLTDEQKSKLLGEALITSNGGSWNDKTGTWNTGSLKIPGLEHNDSLGVFRENKTGKYTFFTAGLDFTREDDAFSVYEGGKKATDITYEQRDNTDVRFWMKDVFTGEYIANETFNNAFTSVDNTNNPSQTLVSEYFKMYLVNSNPWRKANYGVNKVGVFNGAVTMQGLTLDMTGKDRSGAKSTLYHPMSQYAGSENCFGPMSDNNVTGWNKSSVTGSGAYYFNQQLALYENFHIYNGYQFNIHLKGRLKP